MQARPFVNQMSRDDGVDECSGPCAARLLLRLYVGMRVRLTKTVSAKTNLVNGKVGTVVDFCLMSGHSEMREIKMIGEMILVIRLGSVGACV